MPPTHHVGGIAHEDTMHLIEADLAALGPPRSPWEAEMMKIARRELDQARAYAADVTRGQPWHDAPLSGCLSYASALVYAVERSRAD